ncbi:MAG: Maf family nucleotide pyrophosphatase [Salibacteraceae bacterium]
MLNHLINKNIILGSGSPRRAELLEKMGISFEVKTYPTDETYPEHLSPNQIAEYLAKKKAKPFLDLINTNDLVITADTIVNKNGRILNKPANYLEAFEMIQSLSNATHSVITGVALTSKSQQIIFNSVTSVTFCELSDKEINHYIKTYKPFDKAGAYGIQEWIGDVGVLEIKGSYQNVIGLPTQALYNHLKNFEY